MLVDDEALPGDDEGPTGTPNPTATTTTTVARSATARRRRRREWLLLLLDLVSLWILRRRLEVPRRRQAQSPFPNQASLRKPNLLLPNLLLKQAFRQISKTI